MKKKVKKNRGGKTKSKKVIVKTKSKNIQKSKTNAKPLSIKPKNNNIKNKLIDSYSFSNHNIPIRVDIKKEENEYVPSYIVSIKTMSPTTQLILNKIQNKLIENVNIGILDITNIDKKNVIGSEFQKTIKQLVSDYFPDLSLDEKDFLEAYLIKKTIGMGDVELLMGDVLLEEIAINNSEDPVWVYHKKHGWLKTNIFLENEKQIKHYASMIGRKIGRQITKLDPLMDANMDTGDRVNATLEPISNDGNTITIRKFASKPWTIVNFLLTNTMTIEAAALIWLGIEFELSMIIAGGTASGKTSTLNVISNFFPPNHRIISIEDTREVQLADFAHWIPLVTRLPNPEGKGEISMLDLMVNSLRMRPDRILVGEIRRKREAEILFEAIHTGHSVYATLHANNTHEVITRLTNPPIEIPKTMLPGVSIVVVQHRNRKTGLRRTFEIAEVRKDATENVIYRLDVQKDILKKINEPVTLYRDLEIFSGLSKSQIKKDLKEKEKVLRWLLKRNNDNVDEVCKIIAEYSTNRKELLKKLK
ncbi:Flp pilus assembly complex ATPase component TadA [Candidatus Woesearchaeota archaeon]|nr:Flp pilus assembly complex ATPase component TadA [Candidatus Woesearchaeota archaeon]